MRKKSIYADCSDDPISSYHWYRGPGKPVADMEILAPATASTYKYAVNAGANAIYFGYGEFNARASADNFDTSLKEVVSYCHFFNVKAFLALNISFKRKELEEVEKIVVEAEEAGIDAFIITDLALLPIIKKHSKAQVHASTQLGVHNSYGVKFAYRCGFDRVVLSREVTRSELNDIGLYTPIDLEFFIHGALCIGFSGACLLSSMLTGNSGNRGRCNQLCRKFYRSYLEGNEAARGYLLSAKDICMADCLDKIAGSCVCSGKIEGRLRRAEYIAGTTYFYRNLKREKECDVSEEDLKVLFNRGDYTEGYFNGHNVVYPYSPAHIGLTVGKVVGLINVHTGLVKADRPLLRENGYKLMRRDKEVAGCTAIGEQKSGLYVIYCSEVVMKGDCVHLTSDMELKKKVLDKKRTIKLTLGIEIIGGQKPIVEIWRGIEAKEAYTYDFVVDVAEKAPLTADDVKEQFSKTGDSGFSIQFAYIETKNAFLPKSQLNAMRRELLSYYTDKILKEYKRDKVSEKLFGYQKAERISGHFAEIKDADSLTDKLSEYIPNIVYSPETFDLEDCKEFYERAKRDNNLVWIKPPLYLSENSLEKCEEMVEVFDGIVCNNVGLIEMAREYGKLTLAGPSLNIFNKDNPLVDICNSYVISTELNKYEIKDIDGGLLYVYGYLPLMYLSFCPRNQVGIHCDNCYGKIEFTDERGKYLITTTKIGKGHCHHALRNSVLTDVGNEFGKDMYFDFTVMDEEIDAVLTRYFEQGLYSPLGTNKLHLNRGVK